MSYVGVIPYAYYNNELFFLLGKEHQEDGWKDAGKWAHFGGGSEESDRTMRDGAARECYEESMGFLGSLVEIKSKLGQEIRSPGRFTYLMRIEFDQNLPKTYYNVYQYFSRCTRPHPEKPGYNYLPSCPNGYFEKTEIDWFSESELRALLKERSEILHIFSTIKF